MRTCVYFFLRLRRATTCCRRVLGAQHRTRSECVFQLVLQEIGPHIASDIMGMESRLEHSSCSSKPFLVPQYNNFIPSSLLKKRWSRILRCPPDTCLYILHVRQNRDEPMLSCTASLVAWLIFLRLRRAEITVWKPMHRCIHAGRVYITYTYHIYIYMDLYGLPWSLHCI